MILLHDGAPVQKRKSPWQLPHSFYVSDIPIRELDDPPDLGDRDDNGDVNATVIKECLVL